MENNRIEKAVALNSKINSQIHHYGEADEDTVSEYMELIDSFTAEEDELFIKALDNTNCF